MARPSEKKAPRSPTDASRATRVGAQLKQEIAAFCARELADPRLEGLVITSAWVSGDLRHAKVQFRLVTTLQGDALAQRCSAASASLERAKGRIRKAVTQTLGLRVAPEIEFRYDDGQDARTRIEQLLDEVHRDASARED